MSNASARAGVIALEDPMKRLFMCCGLCLMFVASTIDPRALAAPSLDACSVFTLSDASTMLGSGAERMTTHTPANKPPGVVQESACQYQTDQHIAAVVMLVFSTGTEAEGYRDQMAKLPVAASLVVGVKGSHRRSSVGGGHRAPRPTGGTRPSPCQ